MLRCLTPAHSAMSLSHSAFPLSPSSHPLPSPLFCLAIEEESLKEEERLVCAAGQKQQ